MGLEVNDVFILMFFWVGNFYPQKVKTGRTLANGSRTGDDWRLASPVPDPAAVHERLALLSPFEPNHRTRRETTQPTCTS